MITKLMQEIKEKLEIIDKYLKEKEYLRVEERTLQLMQERLDNQKDYENHLKKEIERLNNIINELEKWLKELQRPIIIEGKIKNWKKVNLSVDIQGILDKLKELKENNNEND